MKSESAVALQIANGETVGEVIAKLKTELAESKEKRLEACRMASEMTEEISTLTAENQRLREQMEKILGLTEAWSLMAVLQKLSDAAGILLDNKSYDGHGHESIRTCQLRAKEIIQSLRTAIISYQKTKVKNLQLGSR